MQGSLSGTFYVAIFVCFFSYGLELSAKFPFMNHDGIPCNFDSIKDIQENLARGESCSLGFYSLHWIGFLG